MNQIGVHVFHCLSEKYSRKHKHYTSQLINLHSKAQHLFINPCIIPIMQTPWLKRWENISWDSNWIKLFESMQERDGWKIRVHSMPLIGSLSPTMSSHKLTKFDTSLTDLGCTRNWQGMGVRNDYRLVIGQLLLILSSHCIGW